MDIQVASHWSHKANKHKTDPHGRTPLHTATRGGHFAVVRYLIEAGAGVGVSKNPKEQGWFSDKGLEQEIIIQGPQNSLGFP